jgi:hypothetical protein
MYMTDDNIVQFDSSIDDTTPSTRDDSIVTEDMDRIAGVRARLSTVNELLMNVDKCCDMWQNGAGYTVADIDMVERLVYSMEDVLYVGTKDVEDDPGDRGGEDSD